MNQCKYLDEERKTRNNLQNKYFKLSNAPLGMEFFVTVSESGTVGTSIAVPIIVPVSVLISVASATCSTILRLTNGLIEKKAKAKLNSIEGKITKTIKVIAK
jgi:hypothetical protein